MKTLTRFTICALVLGLLIGLATPLQAGPLPSDPRIVTGKLDNGVRWQYRRHDNPPGKMWVLIHVNTGSLNETDDQQGLAHFMEHMAFNGTENFPPGELIPYFESIGMEFGPDLNASTFFDQTVYMLFLPDTEIPQVEKALTVLSDYAFRNLLLIEEIDAERGVILEELRTRESPYQRIRDQLWPELYEGSRFARRLPIGKAEVIANAPREQFEDYYRTWYRPENVTVVMVGDAPHEPYIPLIDKWFGQYRPDRPARPQKGPEFRPFTKQTAIVVTDPELSECDVEMYNLRPGRPPTTTTELWRVELVEYIANWIMGRRFDVLITRGEASYLQANTYVSNFLQDALLSHGWASGEPADWNRMLEQLVLEISRAREHGFTEYELKLAGKEILADAEHAVKTEPTLNARTIAMAMVAAVNDEEPVLSAEQEFELTREFLPTVTLAEVNASFHKHFEPGTFAYVVKMPDKEGVSVPSRDEVLAAARAAWARKTEPFKVDAAPTELLAELPEPGEVVEKTYDEDLEITNAWLSNGVRLHHRFMDYKKDHVLVGVAFAGGLIEETAENVGITRAATLAVNEGGTSRLTSSQIRDLMTGRNINVGAGDGEDTFDITVGGSPEDLEAGLQLAHALITDGKVEQSAFDNWKKGMIQQIALMDKMVQVQAWEALYEQMTGGDPRRPAEFLRKENIEAITLEGAQSWFDRLCRTAPIEVTVVGDVDYDRARPLIEKYIGSLPERERTPDHLESLRRFSRATGPLSRHVQVETLTPQAIGVAAFASADADNVFELRAFNIAENILSSRLIKRIREDLAMVYSIGAVHRPTFAYRDSSVFFSGAPCDAANAQRLVDEIFAMFQKFADEGPAEEELANAKKQIANNLDTSMREPDYWFGTLRHFDFNGRKLEDEKNKKEKYNRFTAQQVQSVFKKYYVPARKISVTAVPVPPKSEEPSQPAEKKETAPAP